MYADGYELVEIMEECNLNNESDVLEDINSFKELSRIARTFNTNFKEVLVNRFLSGYSLYMIAKELKLSTSTVSKYVKEAGIDTKKADTKSYTVIENWDDFECCPTCNRERTVRQLGLHNQEEAHGEAPTHSFCSACNTEWYQENIVTMVDDEEVITKETRKVLWHTVK